MLYSGRSFFRDMYTNLFSGPSGGADVKGLVKIITQPPCHRRKVDCTQHDAVVSLRFLDMRMILPEDMTVGARSAPEQQHRLVLC